MTCARPFNNWVQARPHSLFDAETTQRRSSSIARTAKIHLDGPKPLSEYSTNQDQVVDGNWCSLGKFAQFGRIVKWIVSQLAKACVRIFSISSCQHFESSTLTTTTTKFPDPDPLLAHL